MVEIENPINRRCSSNTYKKKHHNIDDIVVVHIGLHKESYNDKNKVKKLFCRSVFYTFKYRYVGAE